MNLSGANRPEWLLGESIRPDYVLSCLNGKRDFGKASEAFVSALRALVDEWLGSGRSGGIEVPKSRILTKAPTAYSEMGRWLGRNRPVPIATPSGKIRYMIGFNSPPADGQYRPIREAKEEARRIFVLLMDSPVKYALFKCGKPDCGCYYTLEKPRSLYKRATYCPQHRRLRGTKDRRDQERKDALKIAADALKMWPGLTERTQRKYKTENKYIAHNLADFGLSVKWVTRNLSEIKRRAKGEQK